jgi:hypothetical protein
LSVAAYTDRNPWGKGKKGNWEGPWSDGSKEFTPEAQAELNHKFGNDSVFWISFEDLLRKYQHFDRTRLFMDSPDWRVTQKWISVDVPWQAEFEQRFRIILKKESPVVLVLSQLDDRYFDGLQGQYRFRLQFRLHEVDSPGDEDYIVRSHGNYLMERSVVTELKSLPAGTYSVYVMVIADRDTELQSVEDVIKDQCQAKCDNDKLARVGMEYDHAHKKAVAHMESKAAIREARDKAKAKQSRMAIRRKNWDRTHMTRNILRKQYKKNNQKRDQKMRGRRESAKEGGDKRRPRRADRPKDSNISRLEREDKAVQTEDSYKTAASEVEAPEVKPDNANDKAVQTEDLASSFTDSQGTLETPESGLTSPRPPRLPLDGRIDGPGPVPPESMYLHRRERNRSYSPQHGSRDPPQHHRYVTSEGYSSASPVSDFEDLYSDDDPTLRPRRIDLNTGEPPVRRNASRRDRESDEEETDPWNAVCIVGIRVYSQDEELEVVVFEEGFDDVPKPEVKIEDPGTDGDVEDFEEEELKKGTDAEPGKDKALAVKKEKVSPVKGGEVSPVKEVNEGVIGGSEEKATPRPSEATTDESTRVKINEEMKVLEINREESISSTGGGAALVQEPHS